MVGVLSFQSLVPLSDSSLEDVEFQKRFPSQLYRLENLIHAKDEFEWYGDGTLETVAVLFVIEKLRGTVSVFSENLAAVTAALRCLEIDPTYEQRGAVIFSSVAKVFVAPIVSTLKQLGLHLRGSDEQDDEIFKVLELAPENRDKVNSLVGEKIAKLKLADVPLLLANWKYANESPVAERYTKYCIEKHPTAGVRSDKGELEAWVIAHTDWTMGMLHTREEHRNKGLGKKLVAYLAREFVRLGFTPIANVATDNTASLRLFESLGFKSNPNEVHWIVALNFETNTTDRK